MTRREGIFLCLIGPAAGGKTTLSLRLLSDFSNMQLSVSVTTRPPRETEVNGKSYFFVSKAQFQKKIDNNEFFEWEEVHGNFYGTLRQTLDDAVAKGHDVILDVDIQGALNIKRSYPKNTVIVFVVPPSKEALITRIRARSNISDEELKRRLTTAAEEYTELSKHFEDGAIDYFLVNDQLEAAYQILNGVVNAERARMSRLSRDDIKAICKV